MMHIGVKPKLHHKNGMNSIEGFFGIAIPVESQVATEIELEPDVFIIKLNMNLTIESFEKYSRRFMLSSSFKLKILILFFF